MTDFAANVRPKFADNVPARVSDNEEPGKQQAVSHPSITPARQPERSCFSRRKRADHRPESEAVSTAIGMNNEHLFNRMM